MDTKRFSKKPFPPYRFIPGQKPHPTESPQGHSYKKQEEAVLPFEHHNWQRNPTYLYGVDLYNHGYWWEAHEAFESLWQKIPKSDLRSSFLQGLIKISAALLKRHLNQERGTLILLKSGMGLLKKVSEISLVYMGIGLSDYLQRIEKYFYQPNATNATESDHENYPFLILSV